MSGFVGFFNSDGAPVDREILRQMTACMAYRGPDAQQVWYGGQIGLGHALLRTTFESEHEEQPCSVDGQVWISGDVRLDDRAALIRLLRTGNRTVTQDAPDVELLLHAYHVWGEECLTHVSGDFAFALWDGQRQRFFCARDQLGIAPLYYTQVQGTLIVSNTLQCIVLHPQVSEQLNDLAVADYLIFRMNMEWTTTIFAEIRRLPPAHTLIWADGSLRMRQYWSLPEENEYVHYRQPESYVEHFLDLFEHAVADRLRTDHVATNLSGGMDSTSIATTAHRLLTAAGRPFTMRAYTIDYEVKEDPEHAQYAAQFIGITTELLEAKAYLTRTPPAFPNSLWPEPVWLPGLSAEAEAMHRASTHCRVMLTGYGGDPGFAPWPYYWRDLVQRGQIRPLLRNVLWHVQLLHQKPPLYWRSTLPMPQRWRDLWRQWWARQGPSATALAMPYPAFLHPDLARLFQLRQRYEALWLKAMVGGHQRSMATSPFWSNLFAWADPGYTGIPIKHRYPFFDLRLVGFLLALPRVPWCLNKMLLRVAMQERLPASVLRHAKMYAAPLPELMPHREAPVWMLSLAAEPALEPYVERAQLREAAQGLRQLTAGEYRCLLQALALAYWLRHRRRPHASNSIPVVQVQTAATQ